MRACLSKGACLAWGLTSGGRAGQRTRCVPRAAMRLACRRAATSLPPARCGPPAPAAQQDACGRHLRHAVGAAAVPQRPLRAAGKAGASEQAQRMGAGVCSSQSSAGLRHAAAAGGRCSSKRRPWAVRMRTPLAQSPSLQPSPPTLTPPPSLPRPTTALSTITWALGTRASRWTSQRWAGSGGEVANAFVGGGGRGAVPRQLAGGVCAARRAQSRCMRACMPGPAPTPR